MNKKIFWYHPSIRNYRLPFFKQLENMYDIYFFVNKSHIYDKDFKNVKVVNKSKLKYKGYFAITLDDFFYMQKKVKECDFVITSFATRFYSIVLRIICFIYSKPIISWEEGRSNHENYVQKLKWNFYKLMLKFPNAIFTLGEFHKETFVKMGINPKKIFVANEYPALNYSELIKKKIDFPFPAENKILLYFGRIIKVKGIIYLIDAFNKLSKINDEFVLLIVGDGEEKNDLIKYVKDNNIANLFFLDSIFDDNIKSYVFNQAYIGIVPSIQLDNGMSEGGPLVVLEFLSAGLPVIASDRLGSSNKFIVDKVNGYTVPQKNSDVIKEAIQKLDFDIQAGIISKKKIIENFITIPNHSHQVDVLNQAVNFVMKK